jgi:glycosyltransferase involved in cell wall biosynthesis
MVPGLFTFLVVGCDPARKRADFGRHAIGALRRRRLDVRAIMVGRASFEKLSGEAGFEWYAWVERATLYRELYPPVDALLLTSRVEGFGMSPIQAMSFGRL